MLLTNVTGAFGAPRSVEAQVPRQDARLEQHGVGVLTGSPGSETAIDQLDVRQLITDAARRWELDEQTMLRVAWCESRYDPNAMGPAGAAGLFQFVPMTWGWVSVRAGYEGASPYDPRANVEAAAWLFKAEGPKHWTCK